VNKAQRIAVGFFLSTEIDPDIDFNDFIDSAEAMIEQGDISVCQTHEDLPADMVIEEIRSLAANIEGAYEEPITAYSMDSSGDEILKVAFKGADLFIDKMMMILKSGKTFLSSEEGYDLIQTCFKEMNIKFQDEETSFFTACLLREFIKTGEKFLGGELAQKSS
jgi:hypothetical protein